MTTNISHEEIARAVEARRPQVREHDVFLSAKVILSLSKVICGLQRYAAYFVVIVFRKERNEGDPAGDCAVAELRLARLMIPATY